MKRETILTKLLEEGSGLLAVHAFGRKGTANPASDPVLAVLVEGYAVRSHSGNVRAARFMTDDMLINKWQTSNAA